jgi:iron-sulfur cluster assembly accessory protein
VSFVFFFFFFFFFFFQCGNVLLITIHSAQNVFFFLCCGSVSMRSLCRVLSDASSGGLDITPRCFAQVKKTISPPSFLRVSVDVGGCGGFQYRFAVDAQSDEKEDVFYEKDGAKVVTDKTSLQFLNGAVLDYSVTMMSSAYRIISNPVAESSCGCGSSFALKT